MMSYIWKEWLEQSRGKGLWFLLGTILLTAVILLFPALSLPDNIAFTAFLLSFTEVNLYMLPLSGLFLGAFSLLQEKEQHTAVVLLAKRESVRSFLFKKSVAVQVITLAAILSFYVLFALLLKWLFQFQAKEFAAFLAAMLALAAIFNQIGLLLGSFCANRLQLVGSSALVWFSFVFLIDLAFLYAIPGVSQDNIRVFSTLFFLDPLHTVRVFVEMSLGLMPLEQMSQLMRSIIWMPASVFLLVNLIVWTVIPYEVSVRLFGRTGWR